MHQFPGLLPPQMNYTAQSGGRWSGGCTCWGSRFLMKNDDSKQRKLRCLKKQTKNKKRENKSATKNQTEQTRTKHMSDAVSLNSVHTFPSRSLNRHGFWSILQRALSIVRCADCLHCEKPTITLWIWHRTMFLPLIPQTVCHTQGFLR